MSDTPKASAKSGSPHIADQTLSPAALSRKPVNADPGSAGGSNQKNTNGDIYMFENTPTPSARNSVMDLEMDPQVKLEDYDWAELEEQFAKRMEAFKAEEEGIWEEWKAWGEVRSIELRLLGSVGESGLLTACVTDLQSMGIDHLRSR